MQYGLAVLKRPVWASRGWGSAQWWCSTRRPEIQVTCDAAWRGPLLSPRSRLP
jgi:hypothetical protein